MLLRSRSRTPTYISHSYTGNAHKHVFPSTKNVLLHWEKNIKRVLVGIIVLNSLKKSFLIFLGYRREVCGYAK